MPHKVDGSAVDARPHSSCVLNSVRLSSTTETRRRRGGFRRGRRDARRACRRPPRASCRAAAAQREGRALERCAVQQPRPAQVAHPQPRHEPLEHARRVRPGVGHAPSSGRIEKKPQVEILQDEAATSCTLNPFIKNTDYMPRPQLNHCQIPILKPANATQTDANKRLILPATRDVRRVW